MEDSQKSTDPSPQRPLRSRQWFHDPSDPDMTAQYIERYLNFGLTARELQSDRPIIGIAQSGSDLAPCNRHHLVLADRVKEGIRDAGGIPLEFPTHPIQETGRRPTAALDRNLAYLGLVEVLFGYPLDGVVLTTGCDKTTPAQLMALATVGLPGVALSVGPMLNGWRNGRRVGSGTVKWGAKRQVSEGDIGWGEYTEALLASAPSVGFCNTMGTAATMNSLSEAMGMMLTDGAMIPAPHRDRDEMAYRTGRVAVEAVQRNARPRSILTREAFENAVVVCAAIGGSTNAPIHLNAIAAHLGISLTNDDWQRIGHRIPLLVDMQPVGDYLGEDFFRAGGVPAVMGELIDAGLLPWPDAPTVNGLSVRENCGDRRTRDTAVIRPVHDALLADAGFINLTGNLFDSAIMKTCAISDEFRAAYLSNGEDPDAFEGSAVVFDGREDYHERIDDPDLDIGPDSILVMRGAGPIGHPGSAEVVNMIPPSRLLIRGIGELPCIGDGRQSGTSGSPAILNASPEAAVGGGLALLKTGDRIRVDLRNGRVDVLLDEDELRRRRHELDIGVGRGYIPANQTPWQEIQRSIVSQLDEGMVLRPATKYQDICQHQLPRHNH